ncbi:DUF4352 domain-containing protein [Clostridium psychrophilum]|uniref:DUF4352 domain-containing protein n=1 Tax=Clostridium psychrophilum TaxID=132926 RepID=UPI001C0CAEE0|nr:DUF4352 domain-containing protein [Clostridium psychrophilum]MBU3183120.1 DUF4352 domain-containing protein [Clostridium psychrophilum]
MRKETSKLTNCNACQKEISKSVKKCPSCGHDQRNFLTRHKILTVVLVAIVIIGSTGNSKMTPVANTNASVVTSSQVEKATVQKAIYGINETVKSNHTTVTVTNVKKANGGDYDKPKSGMEFVVVTVLIKNIGTGEIIYNPFNFKMQNSKGETTDEAITSIDSDTQLPSSSLASMREITGTLVFEQPIHDTDLVLIYRGSLLSNNIQFKLN